MASRIQRISHLTKEFYRVPVSATEAGAAVNPTSLTPKFAFEDDGDPVTFTTGEWETDAVADPDVYYARIKVGGVGTGATLELALGTYSAWLQVLGATETPVREVGQLEIS